MGASRCGITSQLVSMDELAVVGILGTLVTSALSTPAPEPPMTEACRFVGRLDRGCPEASSGRVRDHGAAAVSDNSPDPKLPKMDATRGHTAPRTRRGRSRPRILTGGGGQAVGEADRRKGKYFWQVNVQGFFPFCVNRFYPKTPLS